MKLPFRFASWSVKALAALTCISLTSCSLVSRHFQETCQSKAFSQQILADYIATRFVPNSPARLAIVPASVPANMSSFTNEQPGVGNELAWKIHQAVLSHHQIPIVEVLNRQEWPGKKEEFFTGNFGAIQFARDAGYDFVLVTRVEPQRSLDSATAYTKVIDVESGTTIYYGTSTASTLRDDYNDWTAPLGLSKRDPSLVYTNQIFDALAKCIAKDVMAEKTNPN